MNTFGRNKYTFSVFNNLPSDISCVFGKENWKKGRESFALSIQCNKWKVLSSFNELGKPIIIIIWDLFYMKACEGIHKQKKKKCRKENENCFYCKKLQIGKKASFVPFVFSSFFRPSLIDKI